jgi:hypothetical protein
MTATAFDHRTTAPAALSTGATASVTITQYSRRGILAIWAAAAVPMGVLAWIIAPALADGTSASALIQPLLICLTAGMIWQFVLVVGLVGYEQRSLRWSRLRDALWLRAPGVPRPARWAAACGSSRWPWPWQWDSKS